MQSFVHRLERLGTSRAVGTGVALALVIELVTVGIRFGLGLNAPESTSWLAAYTFGYRLHHGYPGLLALVVAACLGRGLARNLLIVAGLGLFLSDILHHFVVLQLVTGNHEFYLRYPPSP